MKSILSAIFVAALLAIPTTTKAINIDGVLDAQYGSAIVTQQLNTSTSDNTEGLIGQANGTELDAAYGTISNGVLYLFLAGNLDSDDVADNITYDKLQIFFMTGPGGDHTLGTNYNGAADYGHLNRMGVGGNGDPNAVGTAGLTFDTGFAPNYWIGVALGGFGASPTNYYNYEVICSNCFGAFLGQTCPSNGPPNNVMLAVLNTNTSILAAMSDINTNGVTFDLSGCGTSATNHPENVTTGVELAIPLSAIGNPTGQVSICAFVTDDQYVTIYNQVLGTITSNVCQGSFGESSAVDFSTIPGKHSFTLSVPPCNAILVNPTSAAFGTNGGPGTVTVSMVGGCSWSVTSNVPWITITSGGGPNSGSGTFTYSVTTNTSIDPRGGTMTVGGQFATNTVTISQDGIFLPPLSGIIIDGIAEAAYGCPVAVQQIGTGFGNNVQTNLQNNSLGGSELDAAYGLVVNNVLYLTLAGNLEYNGNELMIFFMTGPGGQNTLTNVNPNIGSLNSSGTTTNGRGPGLTFDPGFAPNYWIGVNGDKTANPPRLYFDYAQLWPGGTNALGVAANGYYLGSTTTTNGNGTLNGIGNLNPYFILGTINNSNTNGVDGGPGGGNGCSTNSTGALESVAAAQVRSGVELAIPLGAIGSPTGAIAICAYITGSGDHTYLSNQILGPIGNNNPAVPVCQLNLGAVTNASAINLGNFPGQHFFLVGPEMAVKSVTVSNSNATVIYQTEANTNLLYRVERASGNYSTNLVWTSLSSFFAGTGGTLTQIDNSVTSKTNVYYRVRQTPNCQ
jgi:hypothetical protein